MFPIRVTLKKADVDLPGLAGTRQITVKIYHELAVQT